MIEALKKQAAIQAVSRVQSGMRVGLGTGSTAKYAILELARKLDSGELSNIVGVATSVESETLAVQHGIFVEPLTPQALDIAIDGADEIAPNLDLIKGLGAALLREKLVELQAKYFIVIADSSKQVAHLGQKTPVPVEVVRFGWESTFERLKAFGNPVLRNKNNETVITDNGNYILDLHFAHPEPAQLAQQLKLVSGVVETGFFISMAHRAIIATPDGIQQIVR